MMKFNQLLIFSFLFLFACSTGEKSFNRGDYYSAIFKAVNRLSSDPDNRKAIQVVQDGYPMALEYYKEEIDRVLSENGEFKWTRTLEIMQTVNQMSNEIRRVPAARNLVSNVKIYSSELNDVKIKAAEEYYQAGIYAMKLKNREAFKQAYFHFQNADRIVQGYKDSYQKMAESKELGTLKVVVEQIPVNGRFEYSAQFFYDQVFMMLNQKFQQNGFVNFFSPEQAELAKLQYPDMVLKMGFYDFYIDRPQHFEEEKELTRQVEEKYTVTTTKDSTAIRTRTITKRGKIKILTDQVGSGGLLELKAVDFQSQQILFTDKIPGQFTWMNQYAIFVGDKEVLDEKMIKMINNSMIMPPASQDMFVEFTRPIYDQLSNKLINYFKQYN
jgi:sulfur relay (sulfurtransferase) DsrC/TusE family protein